DLAADGEVPVAERAAGHVRAGRPGRATQHLVLAAEPGLRVIVVGVALEARVAAEVAARPLPHVAHELLDAVGASAFGVGAELRRPEGELVEVRPLLATRCPGRFLPPGPGARGAARRIPERRLLPLRLGRQPLSHEATVG